jgi:hypothetical protein
MKLALGDSIVVQCGTSFNGNCEQPAIVNRVWGTDDTRNAPQMVNCMVLPDCSTPFPLGSVLVHDVKPVSPAAGQGWLPRASD